MMMMYIVQVFRKCLVGCGCLVKIGLFGSTHMLGKMSKTIAAITTVAVYC